MPCNHSCVRYGHRNLVAVFLSVSFNQSPIIMTRIRACHFCGTVFMGGRIDRIYCNNSCKCKDSRRKIREKEYTASPARYNICICSIEKHGAQSRTGFGSDLPAATTIPQVVANESARARFCLAAHQQYQQFLRDFLEYDGSLPDARTFKGLLTELARIIALYEQHPFLPDPDNVVHEQLEVLRALMTTVRNYYLVSFIDSRGKKPKQFAFQVQPVQREMAEAHLRLECFT